MDVLYQTLGDNGFEAVFRKRCRRAAENVSLETFDVDPHEPRYFPRQYAVERAHLNLPERAIARLRHVVDRLAPDRKAAHPLYLGKGE